MHTPVLRSIMDLAVAAHAFIIPAEVEAEMGGPSAGRCTGYLIQRFHSLLQPWAVRGVVAFRCTEASEHLSP